MICRHIKARLFADSQCCQRIQGFFTVSGQLRRSAGTTSPPICGRFYEFISVARAGLALDFPAGLSYNDVNC
jgi:hypothetical protein